MKIFTPPLLPFPWLYQGKSYTTFLLSKFEKMKIIGEKINRRTSHQPINNQLLKNCERKWTTTCSISPPSRANNFPISALRQEMIRRCAKNRLKLHVEPFLAVDQKYLQSLLAPMFVHVQTCSASVAQRVVCVALCFSSSAEGVQNQICGHGRTTCEHSLTSTLPWGGMNENRQTPLRMAGWLRSNT